jgi:hypothetical protein
MVEIPICPSDSKKANATKKQGLKRHEIPEEPFAPPRYLK